MVAEARLSGKYVLERELARGGMGSVWAAFDPQLQRRVAVKRVTIDEGAPPPNRERFEREATTIAQLQSPHIVQVFDFGVDDAGPYFVMELLDGEDLSVRLARQKTIPLSALVPLVQQVAKGLGVAHAAKIVHRDLKPANIFLSKSGNDEIVKVLDFGVASTMADLASREGSRATSLAGTPSYMSPEQARGRNVDHRSDLWALAVVAYQALTGALPFQAKSIGDLLVSICVDPLPAPSSLRPDFPPLVDAFFERALARDPSIRFQSAPELAAAFSKLLDAEHSKRVAKVLFVDDEPDLPFLIRQRLRQKIKAGIYETLFAGDGEAALEELRKHPDVDVVFSDIRMPRMDGLTFLARAAETSPMTKVIMVSAFGDMANIRQAMNRGAFDFIVKPIDFGDLEATLEKAVREVKELRRTVRSVEENHLLRMFVSHGLVERMLPVVRQTGALVSETAPGTAIGVFHAAASRVPEESLRALQLAYEVVVQRVSGKGGTVEKLAGPLLVALFRGPRHAEVAADTAVAIRDEITRRSQDQPAFGAIGVGMESGDIASGGVGSTTMSRMDYTLVGPAVAAALRLAASAEPRTIWIGETLAGAIEEAFFHDVIEESSPSAPSARALGARRLVGRRIAEVNAAISHRTTVVMTSTGEVSGSSSLKSGTDH